MLFDPTLFAEHKPFGPGSALRRWLKRGCFAACLLVGIAAATLLFAPLL